MANGRRTRILAATLCLLGIAVPAAALGQSPTESTTTTASTPSIPASAPSGFPYAPLRPPVGDESPVQASEGEPSATEVASSEEAHAEDNSTESRQLLASEFDDELADLDAPPGRSLEPGDYEAFLADNIARIRVPGTDQAQLLVSSTPLRAETEAGVEAPIDLSVEQDGSNFEPSNPLVPIMLPADAAGQLRLPDSGVGIQLQSSDAPAAQASELQGDKVFYHEATTDTDLLEAPTMEGGEIFAQLRSIDAPERLHFRVDLPQGAELGAVNGDGLDVLRAGQPLARIGTPSAVDAAGQSITTSLEKVGPDSFDLVTEHRSADALYPILVDPLVEDYFNNSWAWHGNSEFASSWSTQTTGTPQQGAFAPHNSCKSDDLTQQPYLYCWGNPPGYYGRYISAVPWQPVANGAATIWYYQVPGQTTYVTRALLSPMNFTRGGTAANNENAYTYPYAYWGLYSNACGCWGANNAYYGASGVSFTGASIDWYPPGPANGPPVDAVMFGMGSNGARTLGNAERTANLGGAYITIDDPEPPTVSAVESEDGQSFSSWLSEYHLTTDYPGKVMADQPSLYWRLDDPNNTAVDFSGHSNDGTYSGTRSAHSPLAEHNGAKEAIDFDGNADYIYSSYATRRNLVTNPSIEVDKTGWLPYLSAASSLTRTTTQMQTGIGSLKAANQAPQQGVVYKTSGMGGHYYSAAAQLRGAPNVGHLVLWLCYMNGTQQLRCDTDAVNAGAAWGRAQIPGEDFGPAPAGTTGIWLFATNEASTTQTFYVDGVQLEKEWNLSPYFDGSSPDSRWEGAANASISARTDGPFAVGSTRTFEGWANRNSAGSWDTLFSGGTSGSQTGTAALYLGGGTPATVSWTPNWGAASASWAGAWPGAGQWVHWALVYDDAAHRSELFINGESQGVRTLPSVAYGPMPGDFSVGSRPINAWTPTWGFDGQLDEVAVYDHGLSEAKLENHYATGPSGIGWVKASAHDPGVGLHSVRLTYTTKSGSEAVQTLDPDFPCGGSRSTGTCYPDREDRLPFNTTDQPLPEGVNTLAVRATDALDKSATPATFQAKVDRSTPKITGITGGLFQAATPGYDLHVAATDGDAASPSTARSGVRRIDLYIDGSSSPLATTGNHPCTNSMGSCPLSLDYTLNPSNYSEDDHQFKVIATDELGHQTPPKIWTEFVDNPTVERCGTPSATTTQAVDPLPASQVATQLQNQPDSPIAPTIPLADNSDDGIDDQLDPALKPPDAGEPELQIDSAGTVVDSAASSAPAGGVSIGGICFKPKSTTNAESSAYLVPVTGGSGDAIIYANSGPQMDTIYRPTAEGGALVFNSRGSSAPQSVTWTINLAPGQHLQQLNSGAIAIVDTTEEDPAQCLAPPAPENGNTLEMLPDAETQAAQSEHDICVANNEVDDGVVESVIMPPVSEDGAGNPVPENISYTEIPGLPAAVTYEFPPQFGPNTTLAMISGAPDLKDCIDQPSPCGAYDDPGAVQYAVRYGPNPNTAKFRDYGANDCTNFMSQALKAGNLSYMREFQTGDGSWWVINRFTPSDSYYADTASWVNANTLAHHLWEYGLVKKVSHNPADFRGGDLIAINWEWGANNDGVFDHFQLVTHGGENGNPTVAQHSVTDYGGFEWGTVLDRITNGTADHGGEGQLWQGWGYIVLRPIHGQANIGAKVNSWESL
jgi:hypothetical protein